MKLLLAREEKGHKLYRTFLEVITDDMVELADRQIDAYKRSQQEQPKMPQIVSKDVATKPQRSWQIDNGYEPWVPNLQSKPNALTSIPTEIKNAQGREIKLLYFGDHKSQKNLASFPNPYYDEIEAVDPDILVDFEVAPIMDVEATPFLFIDTLENLKSLV